MFKSKKKIKQENDILQHDLAEQIKKNEELYNYVKAFLLLTSNAEIDIDIDLTKKAKDYELYIEESYLKYANHLKLINYKNIYNKEKIFKE